MVLTELPSDERLEQLVWDGIPKPWNVIFRYSSGPPHHPPYMEFYGKNLSRSQSDEFLTGRIKCELQRLLHNNPQKIIEVTVDQNDRVYVYNPPSGS